MTLCLGVGIFLFLPLTSLHPPSFHKNDFSTCSTHFSFGAKPQQICVARARISLSVTKCCKFTHIKNVNKTCTFLNFDPVGGWNYLPENTHATSEVVGRHLDVAIGALMFLSSILSVLKKSKKKSNTVRNK